MVTLYNPNNDYIIYKFLIIINTLLTYMHIYIITK